MQAEPPLRELTLVVTRPRQQAARTAAALREAGAEVIEFPVLAIESIEASLSSGELVGAVGIIFVSANAVAYGVPVLRRTGAIPATAQMFAIGRATAAALVDAGCKNVVSPQQSIDSEGLLALPQLQHVEGQHIILVKGQSELGGRALLEQTLVARGARVTVLECYRRASFVPDLMARGALCELLASRRVHGCFVLSVETLDSLTNIFASMKLLPQPEIVLLVPHVRVAEAARSRGFNKILEVPLAESAMIAALAEMKPQLLTLNPLIS